MRSMGVIYLEFVIVSMALKIYAAMESVSPVERHRLHQACGTRIQLRPYCPADERLIDPTEIVSGVEVERDRYVVITDSDLESLPVPTRQRLRIEQFVPAEQARDATRFVKACYYAAPDGPATSAFSLFHDVLVERGLVGIGRVVIRERERLAAVEPWHGALLITTLAWPDEVRSADGLRPASRDLVPAPERAIALQIADAMTHAVDPVAYRDTYRDALESLVARKVEGRELTMPAAPASPVMVDLMAALRASLESVRPARVPGVRRTRAGAQRPAA